MKQMRYQSVREPYRTKAIKVHTGDYIRKQPARLYEPQKLLGFSEI